LFHNLGLPIGAIVGTITLLVGATTTWLVCSGLVEAGGLAFYFLASMWFKKRREKLKDEINWDVLKKSLHYYKMDIKMLSNYLSLKNLYR
jgi:hypothetical protein